ncbi:MAG TPA: plastocyanin/azurin family copper-binding protein [Candidatus Magasanikbacteria bacterium]|nr:plastocyanin/azurin family copper-binding protein [Candidatus Magasanikbacteria bacterium]
MKKTFFLAAVFLLVGAGCSTTSNTTITPSVPETQTNVDTTSDSGDTNESNVGVNVDANVGIVQDVVDVTVVGTNMVFDVKEIKVKKGDKVRVTFKNAEGFHDWVLDEFDVKTKQIGAGQEEVVEFTADKTGTFEYYCSVGKHRQMGMKGNLIVE